MNITTDHSIVDLDEEDRPTQVAQPPRDNQPEYRRTRKQPLPTRVIWVTAVVTLAAAGVAAAVGLNEDDTSTSTNRANGRAQVGEPARGEIEPTELDVRGIPTWWSGEQPVAQHGGNPPIGSTAQAAIESSELDVRGIPTWWSGEQPVAQHGGNPPIGSTARTAIESTELDVRGIPTWWSGEPAAVEPLEP